jgi:hypothetical protein
MSASVSEMCCTCYSHSVERTEGEGINAIRFGPLHVSIIVSGTGAITNNANLGLV